MKEATSNRPQEGRSQYITDSMNSLDSQEFSKVNKIIEEHYDKKHSTIMDKPLGEILNNTANFFNNSFYSFSDKLIEAEVVLRLKDDKSVLNSFKKYTTALILFVRDDENIIYLGIIMIIISILICFFNISRRNGYSGISKPDE